MEQEEEPTHKLLFLEINNIKVYDRFPVPRGARLGVAAVAPCRLGVPLGAWVLWLGTAPFLSLFSPRDGLCCGVTWLCVVSLVVWTFFVCVFLLFYVRFLWFRL